MALNPSPIEAEDADHRHGLKQDDRKNGYVKRRHVFFLSGFDPKGAAHYHRIYRMQAALQGEVTGTLYTVSDRKTMGNGNAVWSVSWADTETVYEYVRWDDIVRAHWPRKSWQVLISALRFYAQVFRKPRVLQKIWRVAKRTLMALFYPAFYWFCVLFVTISLAFAVYLLLSVNGVSGAVSAGVGLLVTFGLLWEGWWLEQRLHTSWLLRIFCFADQHSSGHVPNLSARWDGLAAQIRQVLLCPEVDEVVMVGFSVGSMGAVSVASRTVKCCLDAPQALAKLSVLTLGQCIPLFALMPAAHTFRIELACVGANRDLFWVDFSSPSDWGSFALVDPVALCAGVPSINPRVMASPRFHTLFDPATYAVLKKNKRRMHMQYLMAAQLPGGYDYFSLTAGSLDLRQRVFQKAVL